VFHIQYFQCTLLQRDFRAIFFFIFQQNFLLVKGKVIPVLFLTEHNAMKAYCGIGGIDPRIL
jgi:hypothetical protein